MILFIIISISLFVAIKFGIFGGILTWLFLLYVFRNSLGNEINFRNNQEANQLFIENLFGLFGHMAKAKGKVEKADLAAAIELMKLLDITSNEDIALAKTAFNDGKNSNFSFEGTLNSIKKNFHNNKNILNLVLDVLVSASLIDGKIESAEMQLLLKASSILGFSKRQLQNLIDSHLNFAFNNTHSYNNYNNANYGTTSEDTLTTAYAILELDKNATQAETKKQYKRMISKNHPDKLMAKGMPKHLIEAAKEKTQRINSAYDIICKAKGW